MDLKPEAISKALKSLAEAIVFLQQFRNCIDGPDTVMECIVSSLVSEYQALEHKYLTPGKRPEGASSTISP